MKRLGYFLLASGVSYVLLSFYGFQQTATQENKSAIQPDDTSFVVQLLNEKDSLFNIEEYTEAIEKLKSAQEIYAQNNEWDGFVFCLVDMARIADYLEIEIRDQYIEEAILAAKTKLPPDHENLALAYRQKAESFINKKQSDSSLIYLQLAIPISEQNENWENLAMCRLLMAVNYYFQRDINNMDTSLIQARKLINTKEIPLQVEIQIKEWSSIYARLSGDYDIGIAYLQDALNLTLSDFGQGTGDSMDLYGQYYQLGKMYYKKGDYQRSLDYYSIGRNIYTAQGREDTDLALAYYNIGHINSLLKRPEEAIPNLKKCLEVNRHLGDPYIQDVVNSNNLLGLCYIDLEKYDTALIYLERALAIPDPFAKHATYGRLGITYFKIGNIDKAKAALEKAISLYGNSTDGLISLWNAYLGDCYAAESEFSKAFLYYQKALIVNSTGFSDSLNIYANPDINSFKHPIYFLESLHAKAGALAAYSDEQEGLEAALNTYDLTISLIDSLRADYVLESSQLIWGKKFKQIYGEAAEVARRLNVRGGSDQYLEQAFAYIEKSKSSILLDALKSSEGKILGGVPDSLIQKEKDFSVSIAYYEKAFLEADEEAQKNQFEGYLAAQKLGLANLKEEIQLEYPTYHQLKFETTTLSISEVQNFLPNDKTAFIEYFMDDHNAMAFFITKKEVKLIPLEKSAIIRPLVSELSQQLTHIDSFQINPEKALDQYNNTAFTLYEKLFESIISPEKQPDYSNIILVADGRLNTIPFEVLNTQRIMEASGDFGKLPYLMDQFQIRYTYSAALMIKNKEQQHLLPAGTACLAMAPPYESDIIISQRGGMEQLRSDVGNLEGTGKEIQAIATYFPGQFNFSESATEAYFKEHAGQFGIIHLAMHGEADFENPNMANLIFTNIGEKQEEDNRLYHYEIANLDLQAQLVVLSACETGLGKYEEGEGVFSLGRSFMYAGVPSVVMSLWKVSDQSTSQLMPYFYEELAAGLNKSEALHAAKKVFRQEADPEFRHPYYWAAFVLIGDGDKLKTNAFNWNWLWLAVGLIIIAAAWRRRK
ncbi:MAG: CHAT domain-containing protein [Saprospiraceae bacterium]|nr:CHAT domain-containing protein [Saprospiraceae bacterium]